MRLTPTGLIAAALLATLSMGEAIAAKPVCPHPRPRALSLSFSLVSFHPGDLDRSCRQQLAQAKEAGFTTVTVIPTIAYGFIANNILEPQRTLKPGELRRCLDAIWKSGLDVVYQPHLDSTKTLDGAVDDDGSSEVHWRANFDFSPDPYRDDYEENLYGEFYQWLARHRAEIASGLRQVDIVLAAELEYSTVQYPREWRELVARNRGRLEKLGLGKRVRLGINPNWYPKYHPGFYAVRGRGAKTEYSRCEDFRALIGDFDFIAPSFYGDWSEFELGPEQVERNQDLLLARLTRSHKDFARFKCEVPEFNSLPLAIGEFGINHDIQNSERTLAKTPAELPEGYFAARRRIYANLLDWAANRPDAQGQPLALSLWTVGFSDPVGITPDANARPDAAIREMFKSFTAWRCRD